MPLWFLAGADAKQVERLASAMEVRTPKAERVGGIAACTYYTPCPKCRPGAEAVVRERKVHPPALRVHEAPSGAIHPGQFCIAADLLQKRSPLVVLEDARTGEVINRVRSLERILEER